MGTGSHLDSANSSTKINHNHVQAITRRPQNTATKETVQRRGNGMCSFQSTTQTQTSNNKQWTIKSKIQMAKTTWTAIQAQDHNFGILHFPILLCAILMSRQAASNKSNMHSQLQPQCQSKQAQANQASIRVLLEAKLSWPKTIKPQEIFLKDV